MKTRKRRRRKKTALQKQQAKIIRLIAEAFKVPANTIKPEKLNSIYYREYKNHEGCAFVNLALSIDKSFGIKTADKVQDRLECRRTSVQSLLKFILSISKEKNHEQFNSD